MLCFNIACFPNHHDAAKELAMLYLLLVLIAVSAGLISGVVGTGSSIILLPILAVIFGAKLAVPIMAIASVLGNSSRILLWYQALNWRALSLFLLTAIPTTILGAQQLWRLDAAWVNVWMGIFFLSMLPIRRFMQRYPLHLNRLYFLLAGSMFGFLTGLVFSTGPLLLPLFNGFGLSRGTLLATEAAASFALYLTKGLTFGYLGAIDKQIIWAGLLVGFALMIGNYFGKRIVMKLSQQTFELLMDLMLIVAGSSMLIHAVYLF